MKRYQDPRSDEVETDSIHQWKANLTGQDAVGSECECVANRTTTESLNTADDDDDCFAVLGRTHAYRQVPVRAFLARGTLRARRGPVKRGSVVVRPQWQWCRL